MEKFEKLISVAAPLMQPNIDTDIIAPMKRILFNGDEIGKYAFEPLRFLKDEDGFLKENLDFVLNRPAYKNAKILLCGENFGCGSSRENAPEGIAGMGIRCLIAQSFGGIFFKNCFNQGILPIILSESQILELLVWAERTVPITVDLENRVIILPDKQKISFEVNEHQRRLLLEGLDNVGLTLKYADDILAFEEKDKKLRPWVYRLPC